MAATTTARRQPRQQRRPGLRGADDIDGGPGSNQLASNALIGVPVADGPIDVLGGNSDTDSCRVPFEIVEDDAIISCELVNED